jgi:hypothetical protein
MHAGVPAPKALLTKKRAVIRPFSVVRAVFFQIAALKFPAQMPITD